MEGREVEATERVASVNYAEFTEKFGASPISKELIERFERLTGHKAHRFLRRGLYFCHRDFDKILDAFEAGKTIYMYTGRGPSSDALHLGHMIPFEFCKYLQDAMGISVVIQLSDDEKVLRDRSLSFEQVREYALNNARDIIACGFDPKRTFIFLNSEYVPYMYKHCCKISRLININTLKAIFGFTDQTNIGYAAFPPYEAGPAFSEAFPHLFQGKEVYCLIPCGMEQDTYFRMCRDIAHRLGFHKPSVILSRFIPALQGDNTKMSASSSNGAVYFSDSDKLIKDKINKYAFSGGGATIEEHRRLGANLDVDISIKYLEVYLEDDEELDRIKTEYGSGRMLTGEVKKILIKCLQDYVKEHNRKKEAVTDDILSEFMAMKPLLIKKD